MKKLLSILGAIVLTTTVSSAVVACATESESADAYVDVANKTASVKLDSKKAEKLKLIVKGNNDEKWAAGDSTKAVSTNIKDNAVTVTIGAIDHATGDVSITVQATKKIENNKTVKIQFQDKDSKDTKTLDLKLNDALPGTNKDFTIDQKSVTVAKDATATVNVTVGRNAPNFKVESKDKTKVTVTNDGGVITIIGVDVTDTPINVTVSADGYNTVNIAVTVEKGTMTFGSVTMKIRSAAGIIGAPAGATIEVKDGGDFAKAVIDENGMITVTAKAAGIAHFTVKATDYNDAVLTINVIKADAEDIPLSSSRIEVAANAGVQSITGLPTGTKIKAAPNKDVATAEIEGATLKITPIGKGTTWILVEAIGFYDTMINVTIT
ncbi:lipoprotein [Mesoplasma lactucae]|uniref:Uncharacterized protein n=1 Tax=Mesoplasma lactucae ATCC 49193 TaxID=81460 RepID=A0A291IRD8_9MOLU|nr:lipoprotein [Mesoplasma lactucae]ATG97298.1 hypothetical protein CP520_00800 [Mesoplasma lactucae ATCC 49193]ATZ20251.1 hypothetical protein MLACT_v1c04300 [Mesoplasma lactucae ATCC 49193]MCL8216422.1 hypothetical protein [Mesoplasma lactucae ATCC 49193]